MFASLATFTMFSISRADWSQDVAEPIERIGDREPVKKSEMPIVLSKSF